MFLTSSGMRLSRATPIEGTAPIRLMMSENRSSSVVFCSVSRARSSGEAAADLACGDVDCANAGSALVGASSAKNLENWRWLNQLGMTPSVDLSTVDSTAAVSTCPAGWLHSCAECDRLPRLGGCHSIAD